MGLTAIVVGTRNASLAPACAMGVGVVADKSGSLTVYVPEATGRETFENISTNGLVAVVMEHVPTHRTVQVKGRCQSMRPATEPEREIVDRSHEGFFRDVAFVGAPARIRRQNRWPCRAITIEVTEIFDQTPGPRAGLPLVAGGVA